MYPLSNLLKKELEDKKNDMNLLDRYMYDIADFLVKNNNPTKIDYTSKYSLTDEDFNSQGAENKTSEIPCIDNSVLYNNLKKYRLEISKMEGVKPYFVFTNAQIDSLIEIKPKNKEELLKVSGFGEKKVEKYGDGIIHILNSEV